MTVCLESKPVEEIRNSSNNDQETPVGPLELLLSHRTFPWKLLVKVIQSPTLIVGREPKEPFATTYYSIAQKNSRENHSMLKSFDILHRKIALILIVQRFELIFFSTSNISFKGSNNTSKTYHVILIYVIWIELNQV